MRVNPNNIYGPSAAGTQGTSRTESRTGSRGLDGLDSGSFDTADISSNASLLRNVLTKSSVARDERVQQLSRMVQSGSYSVDPAAVGKAMVRHMLANSRLQ